MRCIPHSEFCESAQHLRNFGRKCKNWHKNSSSGESESSGTLYAKETLEMRMQDSHLAETDQTLMPKHQQHQQRQRSNQQFDGGANFDYYVDRKTRWWYYRESQGNPPAASSSSTSQWPTSQWQTSFLERIPETRRWK